MGEQQRFAIRFAEAVARHLRSVESRHHSLIRRVIEEQLSYEPERETRNREPLREPTAFGDGWELRFGPGNRFRVYSHTNQAEERVHVLAVGVKDRNRVFLGGEELKL